MSPDEALLALANDLLDETVEARLAERLAGRGISPDAAPGPPPAQAQEKGCPGPPYCWHDRMTCPLVRAWATVARRPAYYSPIPPKTPPVTQPAAPSRTTQHGGALAARRGA